jgi:hypothetical protein
MVAPASSARKLSRHDQRIAMHRSASPNRIHRTHYEDEQDVPRSPTAFHIIPDNLPIQQPSILCDTWFADVTFTAATLPLFSFNATSSS